MMAETMRPTLMVTSPALGTIVEAGLVWSQRCGAGGG